MQQAWFEMHAERRRPFAAQTWIPLLAFVGTTQGEHGQLAFQEDFVGAVSVAVVPAFREAAERMSWGETGLSGPHGAYALDDGRYKTADAYQFEEGEDAGVHLVLAQRNPIGDQVWHLHQDLVLALGLIEEGDVWVQPDENFAVVAKRLRRADGSVGAIHIRTDFLRDYLCARGMALRLLSYRQRESVEETADHINWDGGQLREALADGRFEGRVQRIHPGGDPEGATVAVFHVSRTDVDEQADIPIMGPESEEGTAHTTRHFRRVGSVYHRISGEIWRSEWIEPAASSPRVRGDHVPSSATFIVDAAGTRRVADELNDEDIGIWLWFDPAIVRDLLALRAGRLTWYTHDTGGLEGEPGYQIHFGINEAGLINVYARDVARLSEWHRLIWAGRNVYPQGGLSAELALSHIRGRVADTTAPEARLAELLDRLDSSARECWGVELFRQHGIDTKLLDAIHRFRATDRTSLLELAKDVARVTADRIDQAALQQLSPPSREQPGTGSLKSLERALSRQDGAECARNLMGPLVGIYELRLGAAHLPRNEMEAPFALVGIDPAASAYEQALQLLTRLVQCLQDINTSIRRSYAAPTM